MAYKRYLQHGDLVCIRNKYGDDIILTVEWFNKGDDHFVYYDKDNNLCSCPLSAIHGAMKK
ncbi:MAG TPA: hypothetical protein P5509_04645 [Bacteroidales bacterium]|nr:hypothetical protein [Bacteroidales bacterium]